jgi:hypothetical protein
MLCLPALLLATIEIPAKASITYVNGSFEQTSLSTSGRMTTTDVTGWSTTSYTFLVYPGLGSTNIGKDDSNTIISLYPGFAPNLMPASSPDGGNYIAADGAFETGAISQMVGGLTSGQKYVVSFWMAGAQQQGFDGATTDGFQVSLGTQTILTVILSNPSHNFQPWQKVNLTFTATTTGSELLSFLAVGTPTGTPPFTLLDGVTITSATPEPAGLLPTAVGLAALLALRRQKKNSL